MIWGDTVKAQRVYATVSSQSTNTASPVRTVTNVANCVSGVGNSAIQPSATPLTRITATGETGALGGATVTAFVNLQFDAAVPANTIVFAKVSGIPATTVSSTVVGAAYNGGGSPVAGSSFYLLYAGDGSQYVAVYATATFNSIRINLNAAGSGALGIPAAESPILDISYAYYNTNGSSAPLDCGLAIGTSRGGNGTVDNPQQAVDGNLATYSTITPAALLSSVDQYFFFSSLSNSTDEVKVTLSVPAMALTLGLANTITVSAYNGSSTTPVYTNTLGTLLSVDLLTLLGNGTPVTTSIKPGVPFDRLVVNSAAVLSVLFSLRVHEVQVTPASPVFTVQNITICANNTATLGVTAPTGTTAKWYSAATGGTALNTGNSFTTPVLTSTTTYYVAIAKNGCTEESLRIPAIVTVLPVPTLPAITGTVTACVGKTTTLVNGTAGGSWTSASTGVATVIPGTGVVTGVSAGTSLITYTVPNANGCPSTITTTVTINALPVVNAITGNLSTCIGSTTALANTTPLGVWSTANPTIATVSASGVVTGVIAGTASINYTVTNGNGCVTVVTANVVVHVQPSIPAISQRQICLGQSIDLTTLNPADANGTTGGSYLWSATAGGAALSSSTVSPSLGNTTYYVRYTKDGCFSDSNVLIVVHPKPPTPHVILN